MSDAVPEAEPGAEALSPVHEAAHVLRDHAMAYPEAWEDFPWGETAVKVRKKAFLFLHATEERVSFTVKLRAHHEGALATDGVEPSGYGLGRHGWVTGRWTVAEPIDLDRVRTWIDESYRLVAPKRLVKALPTASTS